MARKPIRERLIRELLKKGDLTMKQISDLAGCSTSYVYSIRTKYEREKLLGTEKVEKITEVVDLMNRPYPVQKPKEQKDIHLLIMAILTFVVFWILAVVIFSFKG
jgi:hypothetical protein